MSKTSSNHLSDEREELEGLATIGIVVIGLLIATAVFAMYFIVSFLRSMGG